MPIINRRILRGLSYTLISSLLILAIFLFSNVHQDYNSQTVYNKLFDDSSYEPPKDDGIKRLANFYDPLADKTLNQVHINPNAYDPIKFDDWFIDTSKPEYTKMNATMVSLVRNEELSDMLESIEQFEASFNHKYHYDWVFLNDKEFTPRFKKQVAAKCSGNVKFGLVPEEHWSYPDFIDKDKAAQARIDMSHIIYGGSESYRFMCRYQSGFFWRHPIMLEYDWYWRVEPSTRYPCDIPEDLFKYMNDNKKIYGFTQSLHEYHETIPSLFDSVLSFTNEHPEYVPHKNFASFISEDEGETYNGCHFWSNFEIANMKLWRSKQYVEFFDYLDHQGGFFYERHGDAPVHSVFASIFLPMDQIEYLNIGYYHIPFWNVPYAVGKNSDSDETLLEQTKEKFLSLNCKVDPREDFTINRFSCGEQYFKQKKLRTLSTVPDKDALEWIKIAGAEPKEEQ